MVMGAKSKDPGIVSCIKWVQGVLSMACRLKIRGREAFNLSGFVLLNANVKFASNTDVESAGATRHDVCPIFMLCRRGASRSHRNTNAGTLKNAFLRVVWVELPELAF
jgi:hypothetical protein